jgi:hypothetical protein
MARRELAGGVSWGLGPRGKWLALAPAALLGSLVVSRRWRRGRRVLVTSESVTEGHPD